MVNRGGTVDHGKYIFNTLDGQTIALDVKTGKPVWRTQLGNINIGETITMAPLVADGRVYVGNSGGEMGVHGWIVALDENTGKLLWRAYNTGPDKDVLIGPDFKPHLCLPTRARISASRLAAGGLEDRRRQRVGLGHLRCRAQRALSRHRQSRARGTRSSVRATTSGRPAFSRAIPATGAARWYYQYSPHDEHDYDGINEQMLLDMPFDGKMQKVLIHIDRNGYVYVIERTTGTGAVGGSVRARQFHPRASICRPGARS